MYNYLNESDPQRKNLRVIPPDIAVLRPLFMPKTNFYLIWRKQPFFSIPLNNEPLTYCQAERERSLGRYWLTVNNQDALCYDEMLNFAAVHCFADTFPKILGVYTPGN